MFCAAKWNRGEKFKIKRLEGEQREGIDGAVVGILTELMCPDASFFLLVISE